MRNIRDRIKSIFQLNDSPNKLALAFAVGIFIAFSPTIGLHTISCFVLAWMFRLNKIAVFTAAFVNNPWTMVPLFGFCLWFGMKITNSEITLPQIAWNELTVTSAYLILKPYLWSFIVGTLVLGVVAAIMSYFIVYWVVVRYRKADREQNA